MLAVVLRDRDPRGRGAAPRHCWRLADLLTDTVEGGASVGFLAPLDRADAVTWWRERAAAVAAGRLAVWVAHDGGRVLGTVSLALPDKPNSRHRAELVKLMVSRAARGRRAGPPAPGPPPRRRPRRAASPCSTWTPRPAAPPSTSPLHPDGPAPERSPTRAADPGGQLRPTTLYFKQVGGEAGARPAPGECQWRRLPCLTCRTAEDVRRIALSLPETTEKVAWSMPTFRVAGKMFATLPEDETSIAVRCPGEERDELVLAEPGKFWIAGRRGAVHAWVRATPRRPGGARTSCATSSPTPGARRPRPGCWRPIPGWGCRPGLKTPRASSVPPWHDPGRAVATGAGGGSGCRTYDARGDQQGPHGAGGRRGRPWRRARDGRDVVAAQARAGGRSGRGASRLVAGLRAVLRGPGHRPAGRRTMLPVALAAGLLQHGYGAGAVGLAMAATAAAFTGLVVFGGVLAGRASAPGN